MSGDGSRDPVFECAGMHSIFRRLNYSQIIVLVRLDGVPLFINM